MLMSDSAVSLVCLDAELSLCMAWHVRATMSVFKSMLITFTDFRCPIKEKVTTLSSPMIGRIPPLGDATNIRQQSSYSSATKPLAIIASFPLSLLSVHASVADAAPFCPFERGLAGLNVAHAALASAVSVVNAV